MELVLHATPYDISAVGFYFRSADEYRKLAASAVNDYGDKVEEFEIQFIDGGGLDCALARAIDLDQCNFTRFLELAGELDEWEKIRLVIALGECGYSFEDMNANVLGDIDIYKLDSLRALAEQFVEEGLMGEIPENLLMYFDYDALARDLACDYSETEIAGERLIYRCC